MKKIDLKKQINDDLKKMPVELQKRVQEFTHALLVSQPQGSSGKNLAKFAGILKKDEATKIMSEINEGCGKVDIDEW